MKKFLSLLFAFPLLLFGEWDELFQGESDPASVHNVSVISGNLQLSFRDQIVDGAVPIYITRTYSSSGSKERLYHKEPNLKDLQLVWQPEAGWDFFPHLQLLIDPRYNPTTRLKAYLKEPSGAAIEYNFSEELTEFDILLKPKKKSGRGFGVISGRLNPNNNRLHINYNTGEATLHLANGGKRIYSGEPRGLLDKISDYRVYQLQRNLRYYLLQEEHSPSGQVTLFHYNNEQSSVTLIQCNREKTHVYASASFQKINKKPPFVVQVTTSDNRTMTYKGRLYKGQEYLASVENSLKPTEVIGYTKTRKNLGGALDRITVLDKDLLYVEYYRPPNEKERRPFETDKVKTITERDIVVAKFSYAPNLTDVRDCNNILTRYHHEDDRLLLIEYFDESDQLYSSQKFFWEDGDLIAKAMCDKNNNPIFSKTLAYDDYGNIIKETLYANITGQNEGPFTFEENGALIGSDQYSKYYEYDPNTNLPLEETEDSGLTISYTYLQKTDLIRSKVTVKDNILLKTQTFLYDQDLLLKKETTRDDCFSFEKWYTRDPQSGRITAIKENGKKVEYEYSPYNQIIKENIFDENGEYRYSIHSTYDSRNNLIHKSTPLGLENSYSYDDFGNLISSKEVGKPKQTNTYDQQLRLKSSTQNQKTTTYTYTKKGRLATETNHLNETTEHTYDAFGRPIQTLFPTILNEIGQPYRPTMEFAYDLNGNCTLEKNSKNEIKRTSYNIFRSPTKEIFPDLSQTQYIYNLDGTLKTTIEPDNFITEYTYDPLQRVASKKTPLGIERWDYAGYCPLSYMNIEGLITNYTYDNNARLIKESTITRVKQYKYDPLGFLETTTIGDTTHTQIHDLEGKVIQEDTNQENITTYTYDTENQKICIKKLTSKGDALDIIAYDTDGNISKHTDPNKATHTFIYKDRTKTIIDPLQNKHIETYDALNHLIRLEKQNPDGRTILLEENFYDCSGNLAKKITHIYQNERRTRTTEVTWKHDFRGSILEERQGDKLTKYAYDSMGRIIEKTLPNKTTLTTSYDNCGRLRSLVSSDGTIYYQYHYELGSNPTKIEDKVLNQTLRRSYTPFGELKEETNGENITIKYEYDQNGREKLITLPDKSQIAYTYKKNHMTKVQRLLPKGQPLYQHTYDAFDTNGHVTKETLLDNLAQITTTHDLLERPITITSEHHKLSQTFGLTGLTTQITNTLSQTKNYQYDPLSQLIQEEDITYHFDSLGNPTDEPTNEYHQLITKFQYDQNGNPIKRLENALTYTYDPLGRLVTIQDQNRKVEFQYDPESRLQAKITHQNNQQQKCLYLHHKELEIGSLNEDFTLLELKVLGLGLAKDIGASIAIELQNTPYAPLHDFQGNIIALISPNNDIVSTYTYTAFGEEDPSPSQNPWRFCSKRTDENLIYFGKRFYDPTTKRWLTPDPLGLFESTNAYLYALNSPLNRLDALGLFTIGYDDAKGIYFDPTDHYSPNAPQRNTTFTPQYIQGVAVFDKTSNPPTADCFIISEHIYKIQFTPDEITNKKANLLDHTQEIFSKEPDIFTLVTAQNGIYTTPQEFLTNCQSITKNLPEGTPFIGLYNPTSGSFFKDSLSVDWVERLGFQTKKSRITANFLSLITETLTNANSKSLWLHIPHSEAGLLFNLAYQTLPTHQQETIKNQLYLYAIAPAEPTPTTHCFDALAIYSNRDFATKTYGDAYRKNPNYDIRIIKCISPLSQRTGYIADHNFLGPTYQNALENEFRNLRLEYGFYDAKKR